MRSSSTESVPAPGTPGPAVAPRLRRWALWATLACSLGGAGLGLYSTHLTHRFARTIVDNPSGCSINEVISCDVVHATSYAWFLGVPVSWWALLFYLWSAAVVLLALCRGDRRRAVAALAATLCLGVGTLIFSLYKASHLLKLQVFCPICGAMYLLNLGVFVFVLLACGEGFGFLGQYFKGLLRRTVLAFDPQPLLYAALVTAFFSLGYIAIDAYEDRYVDSKSLAVEQALQAHFAQNQRTLAVAGAPAWGNP